MAGTGAPKHAKVPPTNTPNMCEMHEPLIPKTDLAGDFPALPYVLGMTGHDSARREFKIDSWLPLYQLTHVAYYFNCATRTTGSGD